MSATCRKEVMNEQLFTLFLPIKGDVSLLTEGVKTAKHKTKCQPQAEKK